MLKKTVFDQLVIEAIDEVLSSLGEPVKSDLYIRLEDYFCIQKHDIPQRIEEFSKMLGRTFGTSSWLLEVKCMKALNGKIRNCPELQVNSKKLAENDMTLANYVKKMRENLQPKP